MLTAPQSPVLAKLCLSLAIIGLLLGLLPGVHAALSDGLVMRLHLDEGAGTVAGDTSGRDNNGTITASPTWRTTCKVGGCLRFNGTGAYINVTRSPTLNMSGNLTILLWFNETTVQTGGFVVKMKNAPDSGYRLFAEGGTYIAGTLYAASQVGVGSGVLSPITLNRWTQAALTYNGSFLALFVNGSIVDAQTANGAIVLNTQDVIEGQLEPGSGLFYAGEMDEIYIWNRSLSPAEIAYMYSLLTVSVQDPTNTSYAATSVWVNVTLNMDDGNVTAQLDGSTNYSLTNSSGNWNYQLTGLAVGAHSVKIFANDSLGNTNNSQTVYFTVLDTTAPVWTTQNSPASNNNTNFSNFLTLDAGVYDANLNVANLTVFNSTMFPWLYRKTITVTNNNGTAVLRGNYTVNLTFDHATLVTAGQSLASGDDIRIRYKFNTELDRLNITAFNTSTTTIIFRTVDNISAGGTDTNYELYYGNLNAGVPPNNSRNVYRFWDDFSGYDSCTNTTFLTRWVHPSPPSGQDPGNCSISGGILTFRSLSEQARFKDALYTQDIFPPDVHVQAKMRINHAFNNDFAFAARYTHNPLIYGFGESPTMNYNSEFLHEHEMMGAPFTWGATISSNVWYTEDMYLLGDMRNYSTDGISGYNRTQATPNGYVSGSVALFADQETVNTSNVSFDEIIVRQYLLPEPTAALGAAFSPQVVQWYCSNTSWADTEWNGSVECGARNTSSWREAVYYFNLTASDDAGNVTTEYYRMNLTRNKFNFSIRVFRGWNLIGLWENQTLINITNWTAAPANITVAQCFNAQNQSWAKYNWTNSSGNSSYVCAKGLATFLLIGRNDTLNFTEITLNEWVANAGANWTANNSLVIGYNYLLVPGNVSLKNASTWPLKGVKYISCWNASRQVYFSYLNTSTWAGGIGNTSVCTEGQGIVLQALGNETITLGRIHTYPASGEGYGFGYVAAAVLVLAGGAWAYRWYSRKGET